MFVILTPQEVARQLKKSIRWVYSYAAELGGSRMGGSLFFTQEGINHAIQRGQEVESVRYARRQAVRITATDQEGGNRLGNRQEKKAGSKREEEIRARLLDSLRKVS